MLRLRLLPSILLVLLISLVGASEQPTDGGLESQALTSLINKANALLTTGQYSDAVRAYSEAIEQSPQSYLLYYKRATAYLSLSRHGPALEDFDRVIELTGGTFDKAVLQQATIHAKEGRWTQARDALKTYTTRNKNDRTAGDLLFGVSEGEVAEKAAFKAHKSNSYDACIEQATKALETASHSASLRQLRADCALASGDLDQAIGDMTRLTHLSQPSTSAFLRIASITYYLLPPSQQSSNMLKQCLHFDPDSKPCAKTHKLFKSLDKSFATLTSLTDASDWREVIKHVVGDSSNAGLSKTYVDAMDEATPKMELPATVKAKTRSDRRKTLLKAVCKAYVQIGQAKKGESWCEDLLEMDASDVDGLVGRGEALMVKEEWESAVRAFEKAFESSGRSSQDIHSRLQKAQKVFKQSRQKDYYKILGVSRDADLRTIKKAYRKAAIKAHPDKGGSEDKMATVNQAYEVLSNPELRQRFDNGDDPMDPMSQQGGHPFQQGPGGSPFVFFQNGGGRSGGGGAQFRFSGGGFPFDFGAF